MVFYHNNKNVTNTHSNGERMEKESSAFKKNNWYGHFLEGETK